MPRGNVSITLCLKPNITNKEMIREKSAILGEVIISYIDKKYPCFNDSSHLLSLNHLNGKKSKTKFNIKKYKFLLLVDKD